MGTADLQAFVDQLLPSLQSLGLWGYWAVGFVAFLEALVLTSVFAPATAVVLFAGLLISQGVYDFADMIWFVAAGAILGAEASYRIGTRGSGLFHEGKRFLRPALLARGRRFFDRYGAFGILAARFFGPLGAIVPFVAGLSEMRRRRFHLWNALSGFAYATGYLSVGYFFGGVVGLASAVTARSGLVLLAVLVGIALLWLVVTRVRKALPFLRSILRSVALAIWQNPDFQRLLARHPRLFRFLAARLSRESFTGLPSTVLGAAFAYFLFLYASSTLEFILNDPILAADTRLANLFYRFRDPALVQFFTIVTALGYWKVVLVLAAGFSGMLWLAGRRYLAGSLLLALAGNQATVSLLKVVFARPRPAFGVYAESSMSFPSGHAALSVAFYGFATYVLLRARPRLAPLWLLLGAAAVFLIGFSRIYLVEHYLSDVLNGYLVGALWLLFAVWLAEWRRHGKQAVPVAWSGWRLWALGVVALAAAGGAGLAVAGYEPLRNMPPAPVAEPLDVPLEAAFASGRLPPYTETLFGRIQQPVSLIVIAENRGALVKAFAGAGWQLADRPTLKTVSRAAFAAWFNLEYPTAPVTPSFWNGQVHELGFQRETSDKSLRERHHARFWFSGFLSADGRRIYLGTASFDDRLKWGLTHHINPNIDAERNFLVEGLRGVAGVKELRRLQLVPPVLGQNMVGDPFFTDGKAVVLEVGG